MPVVYEDSLKKDISSSNFARIYLIYGDDSYLKNFYTEKISQKAYSGDSFFNLQRFYGEVSLQDVFDAVNQFPVMADRKCVILSDYDFENAAKGDFDKLCVLISECSEDCVFLINFDAVEFNIKRSDRAKVIAKAVESCGGKCVEINHRSITALVKLLTDAASKRGSKMNEIAARYLIEISGNELNTLKNELDKLCSFAKGNEITKETVDLVAVKSVDASVYDYVRFVISGDVSSALRLLDDMFFMRMQPMTILYNISSSYVDIYRMLVAGKVAVNKAQVSTDFEYKSKAFLLDKAQQNLRKFDSKRLSLSLEALANTDKELKSFGAQPRTILEKLTVILVYIAVKGESVD